MNPSEIDTMFERLEREIPIRNLSPEQMRKLEKLLTAYALVGKPFNFPLIKYELGLAPHPNTVAWENEDVEEEPAPIEPPKPKISLKSKIMNDIIAKKDRSLLEENKGFLTDHEYLYCLEKITKED